MVRQHHRVCPGEVGGELGIGDISVDTSNKVRVRAIRYRPIRSRPTFPGFPHYRQAEFACQFTIKSAEGRHEVLDTFERADYSEIQEMHWSGGCSVCNRPCRPNQVLVRPVRDDPNRCVSEGVRRNYRSLVKLRMNHVRIYSGQQPWHEAADVSPGSRQRGLADVLAFVPLQDYLSTVADCVLAQLQVCVQDCTGPPLEDQHCRTLAVKVSERAGK